MSGSKIYTDEEIEKFLAMCDDENGLDDELDNSELESDAEIEQNESLGDASSSEESTDTDEDNIPLHLLRAKSNIIYFNKSILRGKNKHKWSTKKGKSYRYGLNVVHKARGPTRHCTNIKDPLQCFQMFITPEIVEEIVQWTNIEIANRQSILLVTTDEAQRKATTSNEMSALIGLLVLTAVKKDQHLSADELFDRSYGGTTYISIMTKARFKFLMSCLRFDDKSARLQIVEDKFAPIRKIWEMFIQKCRENYTPGEYLTIDEQLLAFRGKCSFRMYIPNKPAKYGLKMVMICDSGTNYMVDAMPYLGKGSNKTTFPLGEYYVKELTKTVHGSNRNVTMDNWFSSIPLAKSLLCEPYKLTMVGTLRSNKREIPSEMKNIKGRKCNTSMFCYDNELTLLSYKPKPSKVIYLLSSCNEEGAVNPKSNKPYMIEFYNKTKAGVDTFDQMCSVMSCSRKTNRWPMCQFFGILNMAFINSHIIYSHNVFQTNKTPLSRPAFMKKLHSALIQSHLTNRLEVPALSTSLRSNIENVISYDENTADTNRQKNLTKKRKICAICPPAKRRMTKSFCAKCKKSLCGEHKIELCASCTK